MKVSKSMFLLLAVALASVAWADDRGHPRTLDECSVDENFSLVNTQQGISFSFYTSPTAPSDCGRRPSPDKTFRLDVQEDGLYTIGVIGASNWIYLTTECCGGDQLFPRGLVLVDFAIPCAYLEVGTYYLTVEGTGEMSLVIDSCDDPCTSVPQQDGFSYEGNQVVYVETVDENSSAPNYDGPWSSEAGRCQAESANEDGEWRGFGYYNWFNQDFGWSHFFDLSNLECQDYTIDSAFVVICACENDYCGGGDENPSRGASRCQWDVVRLDNGIDGSAILNPSAYTSNLSISETRVGIPLYYLEDGRLDVWLDIDALSDQCGWATEVWSSKLVVYVSCRQIPPGPDGYDLGDLPSFRNDEPCYPTNTPESGGPANAVFPAEDQVAWLGECVTHEQFPNTEDNDGCDDGVYFIPSNYPQGSWMPGELACVEVTITTGPGYVQGTPLYLWAWKDGNLDCDFNDVFEFGEVLARECIIEGNLYYAPGPNSSFPVEVCFYDPGVMDFGRYDGYLRFRLLSCGGDRPTREGDLLNCLTAQTYMDEALGETEDFIITDLQLPIELLSFTASSINGNIVLNWTTATEQENDAFEVQRWADDSWHRAGNLIAGGGTTTSQRQYTFVDTDVTEGQSYRYRLVTIDVNGNRMPAGEVERVVEPVNTTVEAFALHQNYPNPFNPSTEISYDLVEATNVSLQVFDLLGREVATLVNNTQNAGRYTVSFNASGLPSGMYFYRLQTAEFTDMKKMMLLK